MKFKLFAILLLILTVPLFLSGDNGEFDYAEWQPLDAELTAFAGLVSAADKLPYFTGSEAMALADFTAFARTIFDDANEAIFKATVNLEIGTDVQAYDAVLDDLAALAVVADNEFIVGTGAGTYAHENPATARTSLGLGTIATYAGNQNLRTTDDVEFDDIIGDVIECAFVDIERISDETNITKSVLTLKHTTTDDMEDGFGVSLPFYIEDDSGVDRVIAKIEAIRDSGDNEGKLIFRAGTGGIEQFMSIDHSGNVDIEFHNAGTIGLELGGTLVTASAAELNLLDGITAINESDWDAANTHIGESGASHSFIDQDVTTTSGPTFADLHSIDQMDFDATHEDKISLYADRLGAAYAYGIGTEVDYVYTKAPSGHRWYCGVNADGGTSDTLQLTSSTLTLNGVATWTDGNSTNANTAYDHVSADGSSHADVVTNSAYSAVGHLPLAGGTLSGTLDLDAQLDLDYTYDEITMEDGLNVVIKNDSTQAYATGNQKALSFESIFEPSEDWAVGPGIYGCYGSAKVARDSCTGVVTVLGGFYGVCRTTEVTDGGAITVTAARCFDAATITKDADDIIITATGVYVAPQTAGDTNYAIYTAGATSDTYLEGSISALDVTDRAQWSAWEGTSKEALDAVLAIKQTGEHSSYPASVQRTVIEQRPTGEKQIEILLDGTEIEVDVTEPTEVSGRSLSAMITLLTEALKEQQKQADDLKAEVEKLKAR